VEEIAQDLNSHKETEKFEKAGYTLRLNRQRKEKVYKDEIEIEENIAQSKKKVGKKTKKTKLDESEEEEEEMEEEEEEEEDNDEVSDDEEEEEYEKKSRQKFNRNAKMKVDAVLKNFIVSDTDSQHSSSNKSDYYLKKKAKKSEPAKQTKKTKRAIDEVEEESVVETTERAKNLRPRPSIRNKKPKIEEPVVEKTERAKSLRTRVAKTTNSKYVDIDSNDENE
jgi:hypothetical protein